jgi:uridylate kinase
VFTADPKRDTSARRYRTVTYDDVLRQGLEVTDQAAFILARDHRLPIHVFDAGQPGATQAICLGEDLGTCIGAETTTMR